MTVKKYEREFALYVQGLLVHMSQSQNLKPKKVTLQSVSSFKAFMGLKASGLASGKKPPGTR